MESALRFIFNWNQKATVGFLNPFRFRLSPYIVPISICVHLGIINVVLYLLTPGTFINWVNILYYNVSWLFIASSLNYYKISRNEDFFTKFPTFLTLYVIYALAYIAYFPIRGVNFSFDHQVEVLITIFLIVLFHRTVFYQFRKSYRVKGGNFVNVVLIGMDKNLGKLQRFFEKPELGYRYKGYFNHQDRGQGQYLGSIEDSYQYILENSIDEIYCLASKLPESELQNLLRFADNNFIKLKIIPDSKGIYTRTTNIEMYGKTPVMNVRELRLNSEYGKIWKRLFDIVFSLLVIISVLSWLTPLMYILIKLESEGPLFFKQMRHGHKKEPFYCLKFRSMRMNGLADKKMSSKGDPRITKVGRFIRKTNIDELPQFFNVFMGHMTVVGPRPHMKKQTEDFEKPVNKYLVRHFSKPGITGLAQIRGYRGEIQDKYDIINRVKLDIFYLENVSFLLDLKIILQTIHKTVVGDQNAY